VTEVASKATTNARSEGCIVVVAKECRKVEIFVLAEKGN
jgi:hypothetical protein